ncbi:MAG: NAD-dependent epimerase/dehydratase family protein [Acidobacteria bacterium]|nr:MAG: NAD-dependent epimerase/dehydratase family protein [Acidobacteriota bacterium]MCE7956712.1 NAD-dependent epimerase/dehydratase family protein [Acidobacteria bacterium ACB2]
MPTVLVTGAAGNLGGLLARSLAGTDVALRLMVHRTPLPPDLLAAPNVAAVRADLAEPKTLGPAVDGADVVVHFAGVLFAPRPERFLPETNTRWFGNLLDACLAAGVGRVVLISFPHVEGPTSPDRPAAGRLDGSPVSVHARTRLEEERLLFARTAGTATTPVVLRVGMVYGPGILMIEAARWLAERRLLAVWPEPTGIHLVATADFLAATKAAALKEGVRGTYHVGDEGRVTLQEFLDAACEAWGLDAPRRLPAWVVLSGAALCEAAALLLGTRSPLTRDFVRIGRVPYFGDTTRFRRELVPRLVHPTVRSGIRTLRGARSGPA